MEQQQTALTGTVRSVRMVSAYAAAWRPLAKEIKL